MQGGVFLRKTPLGCCGFEDIATAKPLYRKVVEESLEPAKHKRFRQALEKLSARRAQQAAASAPK
jgi:hypothetical protein